MINEKTLALRLLKPHVTPDYNSFFPAEQQIVCVSFIPTVLW